MIPNNLETIIREAREQELENRREGEARFLQEKRREVEQNGYYTAGFREGKADEPVVLLHPAPKPDQGIMFHNHNCFELAFVYRGSSCNKLQGYEIVLTEGDLLLLNPNAVHCMCTDSDRDAVFNFLVPISLFDNTFLKTLPDNPISNFIMDYFFQVRAGEDFLLVNAGADTPLTRMLETLIVEFWEKRPGYATILRTGLTQVFVYMARSYGDKLRNLPLRNTSRVVRELMLYIARNTVNVTLADAARALSYNEKYISRLMKQELGLSFTQFVQRQRLQNATELLTKTNLSVEEVIHRVGYTNLSHFYDLFEKSYHMTPATYRDRYPSG